MVIAASADWAAERRLRPATAFAENCETLRPSRVSTNEREELKRLRQENFELKRANAILKDASVFFAQELDPTRRR